MISTRIAHVCVVATLLVAAVNAHGGTFHPGTSSPEMMNYIRNKIGSCSKWLPVGTTSNAANSSTIEVTGPATLWSYRYKNCSDSNSVCAEVQLTFTLNDKPVADKNFSGWAQIESCGAKNGPGAKYKLNASVTDPEELERTWVWFHDAQTNSSGRIWGTGANDGMVSTASPGGIKSFVLYDQATNDPIACCDLTFTMPASTNWTAILPAGVVCEGDDGGHSSHGSGGSGMGGMDGMDGMDHDHDHMAMNGTNTTNTTKPSNHGVLVGPNTMMWLIGLMSLVAILV